jgi:surface antigen
MLNKMIPVLLGVSLLAACPTKRETGAVGGAAVGGLVGGAIGGNALGVLVGGVVGGAVGYAIGREMDKQDQQRVVYAVETNQPQAWSNPDTGNQYRVTPGETHYQQGRMCRDFRVMAEVDGQPDQVDGTACRTPDGRWEAVSG